MITATMTCQMVTRDAGGNEMIQFNPEDGDDVASDTCMSTGNVTVTISAATEVAFPGSQGQFTPGVNYQMTFAPIVP